MKIKIFPEQNYKAFHFNGKTIRIALDPEKPILDLKYPEFYDVKVTSKCFGKCPWCYQSSTEDIDNKPDIVEKFSSFFSQFDSNQKPFQIAFGGGEPTEHPKFLELIKTCHDMGITPNYTTNGMWANKDYTRIINATKQYCGGVAVSTHPHLDKTWRKAVEILLDNNIFTNLHVIIGNRQSIDIFSEVYKTYTGKVKYFVLLPMSAQGRSKESFSDWEYLSKSIEGSPHDIAFGAIFHPYLAKSGRFNVSIYEPESMSAYLDLETMKIYKSSFSSEERVIGI